jgi:hypothetical protein
MLIFILIIENGRKEIERVGILIYQEDASHRKKAESLIPYLELTRHQYSQ